MAFIPAEHLFSNGPEFDFFQAVRLLERLRSDRQPIGRDAAPGAEVVRVRSHLSLAFPPSAIYEIEPPNEERPFDRIMQTFLGLTGPSGVLPRHYTQLLLDLGRDVKGPERRALGDWLALFDHRLVSLFYRAWEKYRFYVPYERGEAWGREPDQFTTTLFTLIGLGDRTLRGRMRVAQQARNDDGSERVLARVEDLALLYYGGMFAQRPRNAVNLATMLSDYFGLPITVLQFRGQWLLLEPDSQTCLGEHGGLGIDAVAGDRVWDVEAKFRVRIGPMTLAHFQEFLPDRSGEAARKSLFVLSQLVRFYAGPSLDFDVQLVLHAEEVPPCRPAESGFGSRLGWNSWLTSPPHPTDADDAVFPAEEAVWLT
jgi:type VI secretion system protein ImpH